MPASTSWSSSSNVSFASASVDSLRSSRGWYARCVKYSWTFSLLDLCFYGRCVNIAILNCNLNTTYPRWKSSQRGLPPVVTILYHLRLLFKNEMVEEESR
jgi:hypothetical protein